MCHLNLYDTTLYCNALLTLTMAIAYTLITALITIH
jgi:hypothetical protein